MNFYPFKAAECQSSRVASISREISQWSIQVIKITGPTIMSSGELPAPWSDNQCSLYLSYLPSYLSSQRGGREFGEAGSGCSSGSGEFIKRYVELEGRKRVKGWNSSGYSAASGLGCVFGDVLIAKWNRSRSEKTVDMVAILDGL